MVGGAGFAEEGALGRGDGAAEDVAAAAGGVGLAFLRGDVVDAAGVAAGVGVAEAEAAFWEDAEAAPFGVFGLHVGI